MAVSEFWQRLSYVERPFSIPGIGVAAHEHQGIKGKVILWMVLDAATVLVAATLATMYKFSTGPVTGAKDFWHGTLIQGESVGILLALFCGFLATLILISRRLHLYQPMRLPSILYEQRLSAQACITSGLLLTGALYFIHADEVPRSIVLVTIAGAAVFLGLRRLIYRLMIYRRFEMGVDTRNVLIVGTGPVAHAVRHHLDRISHLGYTFKGFIHLPEQGSCDLEDVVGPLDSLFEHARQKFIDEIFFTVPCDREVIQEILGKAREQSVDLRVVPHVYDGLTWNSPIEYIGQFPTIPLHTGYVPEIGLVMKRVLDIVFSGLTLLTISPVLLLVAILIKLDSRGPVLYLSDRIGKRGRVFRCMKFRTMVQDAERRKAEIQHMNERDGVLFKVTMDPRITRIGRLLRKYSLDELPQFLNVLRGDMSVVGPRPPLASEVREYKLNHLRRLDVMPGITGLWQVQARQDPSFDSYISLDVTYIENWTIWLDLKIILRTVGVVFAGTGS